MGSREDANGKVGGCAACKGDKWEQQRVKSGAARPARGKWQIPGFFTLGSAEGATLQRA
jgi:hypothetical protein